jgi:hypothetical protein
MKDFKIELEETNMKDFIEKMKNGDGWWDGSLPKAIGKYLEDLFACDVDEKYDCTIIRKKWTTGYGSSFHYHYSWEICSNASIAPFRMDEFGTSSIVDVIFGTRYETTLKETPTGYIIHTMY